MPAEKFILYLFVLITLYSTNAFPDVINDTVSAGEEEYARSCELCHGATGKGDGPYASKLVKKPADLTKLAENNNGQIPITSLYRMIDGSDDILVHGNRRMPIWGFRYQSENISELGYDNAQTFVRGRIFELLIYLDTLQAR